MDRFTLMGLRATLSFERRKMTTCDCRELRELVVKMRNAQKEYFRTRSPTALRDAKQAEAAVDRFLNNKQKALFS